MTANRSMILIFVLLAMPAFADEGMWTYHDFPQALVKKQYGADITPAWLDKVRTATVRLSGCTASFVSPEGLILTNHHCAAGCLDENSTGEKKPLARWLSRQNPRQGGPLHQAGRGRAHGNGERHGQGRRGDAQSR
jgi:hypothetical protein